MAVINSGSTLTQYFKLPEPIRETFSALIKSFKQEELAEKTKQRNYEYVRRAARALFLAPQVRSVPDQKKREELYSMASSRQIHPDSVDDILAVDFREYPNPILLQYLFSERPDDFPVYLKSILESGDFTRKDYLNKQCVQIVARFLQSLSLDKLKQLFTKPNFRLSPLDMDNSYFEFLGSILAGRNDVERVADYVLFALEKLNEGSDESSQAEALKHVLLGIIKNTTTFDVKTFEQYLLESSSTDIPVLYNRAVRDGFPSWITLLKFRKEHGDDRFGLLLSALSKHPDYQSKMTSYISDCAYDTDNRAAVLVLHHDLVVSFANLEKCREFFKELFANLVDPKQFFAAAAKFAKQKKWASSEDFISLIVKNIKPAQLLSWAITEPNMNVRDNAVWLLKHQITCKPGLANEFVKSSQTRDLIEKSLHAAM